MSERTGYFFVWNSEEKRIDGTFTCTLGSSPVSRIRCGEIDDENENAGHSRLAAGWNGSWTARTVFFASAPHGHGFIQDGNLLDASIVRPDAGDGTGLETDPEVWKGADYYNTHPVSGDLRTCADCFFDRISCCRDPCVPGFRIWRNCTGDSTCAGIVHFPGISYPGTGDGYIAANGRSG